MPEEEDSNRIATNGTQKTEVSPTWRIFWNELRLYRQEKNHSEAFLMRYILFTLKHVTIQQSCCCQVFFSTISSKDAMHILIKSLLKVVDKRRVVQL